MAGSDYLVVEVVVAVDRGMEGGSFTTFHLFHEAGERKRKKSRTSYPLSPPSSSFAYAFFILFFSVTTISLQFSFISPLLFSFLSLPSFPKRNPYASPPPRVMNRSIRTADHGIASAKR